MLPTAECSRTQRLSNVFEREKRNVNRIEEGEGEGEGRNRKEGRKGGRRGLDTGISKPAPFRFFDASPFGLINCRRRRRRRRRHRRRRRPVPGVASLTCVKAQAAVVLRGARWKWHPGPCAIYNSNTRTAACFARIRRRTFASSIDR